MSSFQIQQQTAPTRCEICHQADRFDPITETCLRCQALIVAQALSGQEAERYYQRQQLFASYNNRNVPTSDLFRVMREAFSLYRRNFLLLMSITLIAMLPLGLVGAVLKFFAMSSGGNRIVLSLLTAVITLVMPIITTLTSGAMMKAVLDRYRGEQASLADAYGYVLERGLRYIFTSIMGSIYQALGLLLLLFGVLYTYPRGFFMSEVAIVEERYYLDAYRRSSQLGTINSGMLWLYGILNWLTSWIFQSIVMIPLALVMFLMWAPFAHIVTEIGQVIITAIICPFFITTKLLLYFHLRVRSDGEPIKFTYEPAKQNLIQN